MKHFLASVKPHIKRHNLLSFSFSGKLSKSQLVGRHETDLLLPHSSPSLASAASSVRRFGGRSRTQSPSLHGPANPVAPQQGTPLLGGNRRYAASPKLYRSPWLQHQRRASHLLNAPGSSSAGTAPGSTEKSSHSRESGFQSSTSLASLEHAAKASPGTRVIDKETRRFRDARSQFVGHVPKMFVIRTVTYLLEVVFYQ